MPTVTSATPTTPPTTSRSYAAASTSGPAPGTPSQNVGQPPNPPYKNAPAVDGNDEAQYVPRIVEGMNAYRPKIS